MNAEKLDRTIDKFWQSKGRSSLYHLGRCADFAYALQKFLRGGQMYTVGGNNKDICWHVVLRHGDKYYDVRGGQNLDVVLRRNPIALSKDAIQPAGPNEIAHIEKLLNHQFVQDTIEGLKQAEKEV